MLKKQIHSLLLLILISPLNIHFAHSKTLLHLSYDEINGTAFTYNNVDSTRFDIKHSTNLPERVPGVSGQAFRTDGYSTWLTGAFNVQSLNQMTLETWIALESYPSTEETNLRESSLLHQKLKNTGFNLGINTYGDWWLDININHQNFRINAPNNFPLYHWTHIAVTINNGLIRLYVNGKIVIEKMSIIGDIQLAGDAPLIIGRAFEPQISQTVFEVNAINAAYDETKIHSISKKSSVLKEEYNKGRNTPWRKSIAVPASRFANDHLRPRYHAMPPANWTNEPHGLVAYNGRYHMFYQRTPNGPYKWMMHWGNMASSDLINWIHLKDALYPRKNTKNQLGLGSKGIWSGDVVIDSKGKAHAFYTTVNFDGLYNPGIAWATSSDPLLEKWLQHGGIIDKNNPNIENIKDFRDPYLWKDDSNTWHMIIGSARKGYGGVEYYTTNNINSGNWKRARKSFATIPFKDMDIGSAIWEMPVFEYIGMHNGQKKYALIVSPIGGSMKKNQAPYVRSVYWVGTWRKGSDGEAGQFTPDHIKPKNFDIIHGYISPTVVRNSKNQLVAIGIVDERTNAKFQNDLGWAHAFSLPRIISLLEDGETIGQVPSPQLKSLRTSTVPYRKKDVFVNGEYKLPVNGGQLEMNVTLDANTQAKEYGFLIATSPNKEEFTKIYFDGESIVIDKQNSTLTKGLEEYGVYSGSYDSSVFGKPENFHIFIDNSIISVFINNKAVFSNRIYPSRKDSTNIYLFSKGGETYFKEIEIYKIKSIN